MKARRTNPVVDSGSSPLGVQTRSDAGESIPAEGARAARENNLIVEAALTRVMRAKQESLVLPSVTVSAASPAKPSGGTPGIIVDRQATARAIAPAEEARPMQFTGLAAETVRSGSSLPRDAGGGSAKAVPRRTVVAPKPHGGAAPSHQPDVSSASTGSEGATLVVDPIDAGPLEEIDPVDYLEAEVRKVDQALARELMTDDAAPAFTHVMAAIADLLTIAASSVPFLALSLLSTGSLTEKHTLVGLGILVGLVGLFYLSLTQSLCGKTFGMMFTNTRLIDAATGRRPSVKRAILRALCYPIALAPGGIGVLWVAIDPKRRCWQDIVSGTRMVRDF